MTTPSTRRILITDCPWQDQSIEREVLVPLPAELVVAPAGDEPTLAELARDCDAILACWARVTETVIAASPRLRIVARLGIGLDNIDLAAATARKILVTNVPDYCLEEVAEHTLALVFALGRKVAFYHHQTKSGRYDLNAGPPLRRLCGQTLGIVGLGRVGRSLATKALALGFRVVAFDPSLPDTPPGVERVEFDALLTQSDVVSLHAPATPETRRMIGAAALAKMKPTACLINTARGTLVDHAALAAALAAGRLGGAGLDVHDPEPPPLDRPPWNDPRVIVTPHAAFLSEESLRQLRRRSAEQVRTALTGGVPENVVNPQVLDIGVV